MKGRGKATWVWAVAGATWLCGCQGRVGGTGARGNAGAGGAPPSASGAAGSAGAPPAEGGATTDGRLVRRMSADQIRAAFLEATGFAFTGKAVVRDPSSPGGASEKDDADILDVYAGSLGRPDYNYTVRENLEPGVSFSKFVADAARDTCGRAARREASGAAEPRRLFVRATMADTWPSAEPALRANAAALVLRFWGRAVDPGAEDVTALIDVFRAAAAAPAWTDAGGGKRPAGTPADGWRAVCIALASDPQFYVY